MASYVRLAMPSDHRMLSGLQSAMRIKPAFGKPKPTNAAAKLGLTYERRVERELKSHVTRGNLLDMEHTPWFTFYDDFGNNNCSPDFLLLLDAGLVVVEVKLTWVPHALPKLTDLYCPVVSLALHLPVRPLVICKHLTPAAPAAQITLRDAILSREHLMLYPANGKMQW